MKDVLVQLIKPFAEKCFDLVNTVKPPVALIIYVVLMLLLGVWVMTLKQEKQREDGTGQYSILHDLRTWAMVILLLQIIIYLVIR